ncbi:hypothetical protein CaCOL14_006555 [Colletotrichum acutatum]
MPPHLPNEVLLAVIGTLRSSKSTLERPAQNCATLSKLCRVSRGFQQVAEPFLYESIFLSDDRLSAFVVTIEHRPYLGSYVKELDIPVGGLTGLTRFWLRKRLEERQDSIDHSPFRRAIGLALNSKQLMSCRDADLEGIYLLLLAMLLPKVEVVHFAPNTVMMEFVAEVDRSGPFPRLQQVYAEGVVTDEEGLNEGMPARLCEAFLSPTVQIFHGFHVEWLRHIKWRGAERMSLKSVHLGRSLCNGIGVKDLLSHCPDLERVSIKWAGTYLQHDTENIDFPFYDQIGEALRRYGHNLRELELDCLEENHYNCDYPRTVEELEEERIGSLWELMRLRTLRLPLDLLLGEDDYTPHLEEEDHEIGPQMLALTLSDVLPSSLEILELMSCPWNGIEHLHTQIHDLLATGQMANLRSILVERHRGEFHRDIAHLGWNASIIEDSYTSLPDLKWEWNTLFIARKECSRIA